MVTLQKIGSNYNYKCLTITGLSTDKKPIGEIDKISITNGSVFKEIDTGREYNYDAETQVWIESISSSAEIVEGKDGITPMFQKSDDAIQVSYDNGLSYVDLVLLSEIKGDKGDKGEQGTPGNDGKDGEQGAKGDPFTYEDFTQEQLASLKGEKGETGAQGLPGKDAEITIDTELSKESNNAIANSAVANILLSGRFLDTYFVKSEEEWELLATEMMEKFSEFAPLFILFGYDGELSMGSGYYIFDSGSGSVEDAIVIPSISAPTESTLTWKKIQSMSGTNINFGNFLNGESFTEVTPMYFKLDIIYEAAGENLTLVLYGSGGGAGTNDLGRSNFLDVLNEDEELKLHIAIEPGDSFWLVSATCYGSKGIKTITRTSNGRMENGYISKIALQSTQNEPKNIELTEVYGKRG